MTSLHQIDADRRDAAEDGPETPQGWSAVRLPFQTLSQVRKYVAGETIECLVCGRHFKRLQYMHLLSHQMTADDYRAAFGIPWGQSLTSAPSRKATGDRMTPERIEKFLEVRPTRNENRRPSPPAVRNQWKISAKKGRVLATTRVIAACAKCGTPFPTTALTAAQPLHCDQCASPGALKTRQCLRRKKLRVLNVSSATSITMPTLTKEREHA